MMYWRAKVGMRFQPGLGAVIKLECGHESPEWTTAVSSGAFYCARCAERLILSSGWPNAPILNEVGAK